MNSSERESSLSRLASTNCHVSYLISTKVFCVANFWRFIDESVSALNMTNQHSVFRFIFLFLNFPQLHTTLCGLNLDWRVTYQQQSWGSRYEMSAGLDSRQGCVPLFHSMVGKHILMHTVVRAFWTLTKRQGLSEYIMTACSPVRWRVRPLAWVSWAADLNWISVDESVRQATMKAKLGILTTAVVERGQLFSRILYLLLLARMSWALIMAFANHE